MVQMSVSSITGTGLCLARIIAVTLAWSLPALAATSPPPSATPGTLESDQRPHEQALARAQAAVVGVQVTVVDDARSIETLGRRRQGTGVVIDANGLVLTIGYLILEAERVDLVLDDRRKLPARVVAYDLASGFGLLQALTPVQIAPARLGSSSALTSDEPLMVASGGQAGELSLARMVSRRPFSGYWEYHIDAALFTTPPRNDHSGAGLFNIHGELLGIGSLVVADAQGPGQPRLPGNMFVPVDLLRPILAELRERGASRSSTRAWLGLNCAEQNGAVRVVRTSRDSPAEVAGLLPGDRIVSIDGAQATGLEMLYKTLWSGGDPQRKVSLEIERGGETQTLTLRSVDRMKTLSQPKGI